MTVWIYVDTSKEVGDIDHFKVFRQRGRCANMATGMTRKASLSNMRSWSEPRRPPHDHVQCCSSRRWR